MSLDLSLSDTARIAAALRLAQPATLTTEELASELARPMDAAAVLLSTARDIGYIAEAGSGGWRLTAQGARLGDATVGALQEVRARAGARAYRNFAEYRPTGRERLT